MSTWPASHRFELTTAPEGLGLVHDFLNTVHQPDLLADTALAQQWLTGAVRMWSELRGVGANPPGLADADLPKLRALRRTIAQLVRGETPAGGATAAASLVVSDSGEVRLEPAGTGWRWLASALWGEILLSQQAGTWRRLKQCHNDPCESTFYDRSKNNSGVWCNVKTCGNVANLRASRARRRERERAAQN
ncbi:CGNR zinc finger domain-containing protein [Mycobacterium genavense]|uniref:CGNR zinc finger domain-containing protein n=1 Tax=Mycobacterium genavense TaxID=36812 RepID=UPI0004BB6AA2|nr:CGNR zinc finger domain-containing protein [Mycobacterium genavense]